MKSLTDFTKEGAVTFVKGFHVQGSPTVVLATKYVCMLFGKNDYVDQNFIIYLLLFIYTFIKLTKT